MVPQTKNPYNKMFARSFSITLILSVFLTTFVSECVGNSNHHHHYSPIADYCKGKSDGLYSHPQICSQFIQCSNQVTHMKVCSDQERLVFNPNSGVCDWKSAYPCQDSAQPQPGRPGGGHGAKPPNPSKATTTMSTTWFMTLLFLFVSHFAIHQ